MKAPHGIPAQPDHGVSSTGPLHTPTYRLNLILFLLFLILAVGLGLDLPDRYPTRFALDGTPTDWAGQGPGMWILLVSICAISFLQLQLLQRYLFTDPPSRLLNLPHREQFAKLPAERRMRVLRRANRILGLTNTGMLLIFSVVLFMTWAAAHRAPGVQAANMALMILLALAVIVPVAEAVGMSGMVKRELEEAGLPVD